MLGEEQYFQVQHHHERRPFLKTSSSVICLINIGFCLGATPGLLSSAWMQHTCVVWVERVSRRGMFGPNASFGVQTTSMKKTFGFRSFSVFRISDKRLCTCIYRYF
jgi:hypothetical protein